MYLKQKTWIEYGPAGRRPRPIRVPALCARPARGAARRRGLGLGPDDPCYDPSRSSWLPYWWNNPAECQCMVDNWQRYGPNGPPAGQQCVGYCSSDPAAPLGLQCFSVSGLPGTAAVMGQQAGAVVGDVTSTAADVVTNAVAGAGAGLAQSTSISGWIALAAAVAAGVYGLKLALGR